jgi:hypothetical protein
VPDIQLVSKLREALFQHSCNGFSVLRKRGYDSTPDTNAIA